jgi:hypothetical protein
MSQAFQGHETWNSPEIVQADNKGSESGPLSQQQISKLQGTPQ